MRWWAAVEYGRGGASDWGMLAAPAKMMEEVRKARAAARRPIWAHMHGPQGGPTPAVPSQAQEGQTQ